MGERKEGKKIGGNKGRKRGERRKKKTKGGRKGER